MSFIDNIIGAISPKAGYAREAWRQAYEDLKQYDAGNGGRLNANWRAFNESAESSDRWNRDLIRARARDLERNSDIAQSVVRAYRRNVIGKGFTLQAKTSNPDLNNQIERVWKVWCKAQNCDVTGTQSFNQILRMAVERKKVDGGVLILKRYTAGGPVPLALQAIEVDELDTTQVTPKTRGNKVVGGIEYNSYNKAVGYYIRQYDIEGFQIQDAIYVQAKDVIFYFSKNRPSQIREISDLTPTVTRIRDINEFITAVSVKERIAACLSAFIEKATPSGGGLGRSANMDSTTAEKIDYSGKRLSPGMIMETNPGEKVTVVDPKNAGGDAAAFLKLQQGLIGAGQGLSYEATSRDMSMTNYSSARQGMIEDDGTYEEEIELIRDKLMSEIYESFVISGYLAGVFNMPGFWDKKQDYLAHLWVKAPKPWIDPLKESAANKTALNSGQKTYKQIAAENGRDWKEMLEDMAEVQKYALSLGVDIGSLIYGKPAAPKAAPNTGDNGSNNENQE
jgi:lambda family phage portal protein